MLTDIKIALLKNSKDNYPLDRSVSYTALEKLLTTFISSSKNTAPGLISGNFGNSRRISSNLRAKSLIFLDIDYYDKPLAHLEGLIHINLGKYKFIVYSTASHVLEKARVRITLFLNREVNNLEEYKSIASGFIASLDTELKKSIEIQSSITPNHFMYLPIIPHENYIPWYDINDGKLICTEEFLSKAPKEFKSDDPLLNITRNTALDISHDDIVSCLQTYKAEECDYHEWREVGQALHHQYSGRINGFRLWDAWSKGDKRSGQYQGTSSNEAKWNSFSLTRDNPLTFATILYKVKKKEPINNRVVHHPIARSKWAHTYGEKLNPLFTEENCKILFKEYKVDIKYDVIKKESIVTIDGKRGDGENDDITRIKLLFSLNRIPATLLLDTIDLFARNNSFNSWKDWIKSRQWDGVDRFKELCETIEVLPQHITIRDIYLKRWLIQMIHMTCLNDELSPKTCRMVLLFQGKQFIGKSTWLTSLAPKDMKGYIQVGKSLNSTNDMDILSCIKKVFVELGEITSTFRKNDIENLKNFISSPVDILNRKYKSEHEVHRRRTVFFGTTNESNFLSDKSGNSRFLVLPVLKCNALHQIDMQQLYAQLMIEAIATEDYNLLGEEYDLQSKCNEEFESISALEEKFVDMFDIDSKDRNALPYTATKVLEELGFNIAQMTNKKRIANEMGSILNKHGFKKNAYPRGWFLPPKRINDDLDF
jgi:hypothetical protein